LQNTKKSKNKNTQLTSIPTKMQQPDAEVSNRATMCKEESLLRVIQRMTQQRILTGTNIGLANTNSCNFSNIFQDDTDYSIEIYSLFKRKVFSS